MSFLTSLGNIAGGIAQGRQQAYRDALSNQELDLEKQNAANASQMQQAQLDQIRRQNAQAEANRQFESGLQLPKNWATLQPDQRIAYLTQRYNAAQRAGDDAVAKQTLDEMNSLELGAERLANANYTTQGKLPLAQAQAGWWRQRHNEVMSALQSKERIADAQTRAAMARAQLSANTRLQAVGMTNDEREYVAAQTALNVANRMDENQAFQAAMAQYKSAASQWAAQEKQYNLGLGANPGAAPTPQQFIISAPAASAPSVVVVPVTLPNGQTVNVPSVNPNMPKPNVVQQGVQEVQAELKKGTSPAKVVQVLQGMVDSGKLSRADQQNILKEVFGHPSGLAPLPVQ